MIKDLVHQGHVIINVYITIKPQNVGSKDRF